MGKGGKVRFDGLDVAAMVAELGNKLLSRRTINIYDGVSDTDSFLFKLDGGGGGGGQKTVLFVESGIRFHITNHQAALQQEGMPSAFCSKLRKHLRGLRLERVVQLGNYDRVVNFVFGTGESRHCILLELYAKGNLLLTDGNFKILALLRPHEYDDVKVKVGQVYPVTYATSISQSSNGLIGLSAADVVQWVEQELALVGSKSKKSEPSIPLKALLLKPSSGVYHYGPALIEHCIVRAGLNPMTALKSGSVFIDIPIDVWENLVKTLEEEGKAILTGLNNPEPKGYILYRDKPQSEGQGDSENPSQNSNRILEEFQPHLLSQHKSRQVLNFSSFAEAVDEFFAKIGQQKRTLRAEAAEAAAREKLEKIRRDQEQRVETLQKEQEKLRFHAELVEAHAEDVDKALAIINSALDSGMDWEALNNVLQIEKQRENHVATMIKKLDLANNRITLSLTDLHDDTRVVDISVSLGESAHGNARTMFSMYRAFKEKSRKTLENSEKAMRAAETNAKKQLLEAQQKGKLTLAVKAARKPHWFEKFHWFITSDNYLVLAGRDAHQNELLVKRYLRPGDAYLHADVHGAASCVLRAKRRRTRNGKTMPIPLSDEALRQAGNFTICQSSAWKSRMITSAWWVQSHQVSKTAPSGEYLTVGSFMVRGRKNFLPPSQLEMGLAVLFRLGDDDSIARHKNERRDFALLNLSDESESDEEPERDNDQSHHRTQPTGKATATPNNSKDLVQDSDEENFVKKPVEGSANDVSCDETQGVAAGDEIAGESSVHGAGELSVDETPVPSVDADCPPSEEPEQSSEQNDGISDSQNVVEKQEKESAARKKGLSVRDRKLIKRYGSLEAAAAAACEREGQPPPRAQKNRDASDKPVNTKRGKKGKMKKLAKKYADQDDDDRELALMALHGGEKKAKRSNAHKAFVRVSKDQEVAARETAKLLLRDAHEVAKKELSPEVKALLEDSVTVEGNVARWDKFDADVIDQVASLGTEEQRLAAARRLLELKRTTRVDNFSASLSGIVRTIRKYGNVSFEDQVGPVAPSRKSKAERSKEDERWKEVLAEEGVVEREDGEDIDDTLEISKLTGKPMVDDLVMYALPVCAPYHSISQYKYRVKLTPGNLKKGKAAKQCFELFLKDKVGSSDRSRDLLRHVGDGEWVQAICADVKIATGGQGKPSNKQKSKKKR